MPSPGRIAPAPSFEYIETEIPPGLTLVEYRRLLAARRKRVARRRPSPAALAVLNLLRI